MIERLGATVPIMTCGGNHEIASGEAWVPYNLRWPMPSDASGSTDSLYWSRNIGPMHVITLNSYAGSQRGRSQYCLISLSLGVGFALVAGWGSWRWRAEGADGEEMLWRAVDWGWRFGRDVLDMA